MLVDTEQTHDSGKDSHDTQENGAGQRDAGHDLVDILRSLFAGFHAGDKAVVLLQILRNLLRVDGDCRVEIGEGNDHQEEDDIVSQTVIINETAPETGSGLLRDVHECQRNEHQRLGEDDRHNASGINLKGQVVTNTTVLFVADHAFRILDGNATGALNEHDTKTDDQHHQDDFQDEDDRTAVHLGDTSRELCFQGERQTGDNTDHDDHGNTVADTVIRDTLAEPHDEQGGGDQQDKSTDGECGESEDAGLKHRGRHGTGELHGELGDVGRCLNSQHSHCEVTGDLVDFGTAAFTFLGEALEIRHCQSEELHHDGCRDVRHDTQREDGGVGECAAGEEVKHAEQTLAGRLAERRKGSGVDAREHHMGTEAIYQDDEEGIEDALPQVLNPEYVLNGFDELFHCKDFLVMLLGCGCVDEFSGAAALFNHGFRLGRILVSHDVHLGGELAFRQDGDEVVLLGQAVVHKHLTVDFLHIELLGELLQGADIDGVVLHTVDILETSLGQYSVDRHLAAFETDFTAVTGAGLCALVAARGSAAFSGTLSSANSAFSVC